MEKEEAQKVKYEQLAVWKMPKKQKTDVDKINPFVTNVFGKRDKNKQPN